MIINNTNFDGLQRIIPKTDCDIANMYMKAKKPAVDIRESEIIETDTVEISSVARKSYRDMRNNVNAQDPGAQNPAPASQDNIDEEATAAAQGLPGLTKKEYSEDEMREKLEELRQNHDGLVKGLKDAQAAGEGMAEAMKIKLRCMKIAMRIISGDNVPKQDEQYLAENDIELWGKAKSMRIEKQDPEDLDSLLEEEKKNDEEGGDDVTGAEGAADAGDTAEASSPDQAQPAAPETAAPEGMAA